MKITTHNFEDDSDSRSVTSESSLKKRQIILTNNAVTKKVKKPTQGDLVGSQIEMIKGMTQIMNHRLKNP